MQQGSLFKIAYHYAIEVEFTANNQFFFYKLNSSNLVLLFPSLCFL